jgi:hypothetical protein
MRCLVGAGLVVAWVPTLSGCRADRSTIQQPPEALTPTTLAPRLPTLESVPTVSLDQPTSVVPTFTPGSAELRTGDSLIYVRSGKFYRVHPGAVEPQELQLDNEQPPIWSPPEDPGRAWASPDGRRVAYMAGTLTPTMWAMNSDGSDNHAVSAPLLPDYMHELDFGDRYSKLDLHLFPGKDYTVALAPSQQGGDVVKLVMVDDLTRTRREDARVRVLHLAPGASRARLTLAERQAGVIVSGVGYGRASANQPIRGGVVDLAVGDENGKTLLDLPPMELAAQKIFALVFVGGSKFEMVTLEYTAGESPGSQSRVRLVNAVPSSTVNYELNGRAGPAIGYKQATPYTQVPAEVSADDLKDLYMAIYGTRPNEYPVAWDPSGEHLACVAYTGGQLDLMLASFPGPSVQVTNDRRRELNPVWSPDGRHVAFRSLDEALAAEDMYIATADGQTVRRIDPSPILEAHNMSAGSNLAFPERHGWIDSDHLYLYPAGRGSIGIWVYEVSTERLSQVYGEPISSPDWSPDSHSWVVVSQGRIVLVPLQGEAVEIVSEDGHAPRWTPDGRRVSYTVGDENSERWPLRIVNADGSGDRELGPAKALVQDTPPVTGPAAKRLFTRGGLEMLFTVVGSAYGLGEGGLQGTDAGADLENIWKVSLSGGQPQQMTDLSHVFYVRDMAESSDGRAVAFIGFDYRVLSQQLYAAPAGGGRTLAVDGGVRWFQWLPAGTGSSRP